MNANINGQLAKAMEHPAIQELIRSHREVGEPIIDTSDPWDEPFEQQIIREWEEEHGTSQSEPTTHPALPQRPESVDRSIKIPEEQHYWSTRTAKTKPVKKPEMEEEFVQERRWTGLSRNMARLNDNQTKQFQILRRELDQAVIDGHATHEVSVRLLKIAEAMLWNQTQFQGEMMEVMLDVQEKVSNL